MWGDALNLTGTLPVVVVMVQDAPSSFVIEDDECFFAFVLVACCVCKGVCILILHIIIIKLPLSFFRVRILVHILLLV
jgi:hypothetical protein